MNATVELFRIPCPHAANSKIPSGKRCPDYHPLSPKGVKALLDYAKENCGNSGIVAAVQVRLTQAIPGMTCPKPIRGKVANRSEKLDQVYITGYKTGGTPELVHVIVAILQPWRHTLNFASYNSVGRFSFFWVPADVARTLSESDESKGSTRLWG